jgi:hypothetical protein
VKPAARTAREVGLEVVRPVRDVLQALAAGGQEVAVHRRRVVPLLDELDLQVARVAERDRDVDRRRLPRYVNSVIGARSK